MEIQQHQSLVVRMWKKRMTKETLVIFKEKSIRRTWFNEAWWFVITDVIAAITDSVQPAVYIKDMRRREPELNKGWGQIATPPFG